VRCWLPILLALAVAPSARAASFTETQTLADWGSSNGSPAAAPGFVGWTSADAVHVGDATIPAVGAGLKIAPGATAAWTGSDGPHLWHGSADSVPAGALTNLRGLAVAPNDAAWIGVAGGGSKQVQVSHFDGSTWTAARTLPELNPSNYAMAGAGDGGHVLFAWHSAGGDPNRIIYSADGADPQFLTPAGEWNANPSVAVAPTGTAVIAWARGNGDTTIVARTRATDGTWGPETALGDGNLPSAAMTADGTAVVAWRGADLAVYVSRNLAAPERIVGDTPGAVVASTAGNDTIVAWTALPANGDYNTDGRVEATAAAPGEHFGAPVILADGYARESLAAGGDAVIWSEVRNTDSRIRAAHLQQAQAPPAGGDPGAGTVTAPPASADRTRPKLTIRHLSRHRIAIRANETVTIRVAKRRFTVHANKQRIVTFGKGRFTLKATDRAGNTRTLKLRVK
jgi:hypothetical protein